MTLAKQLAAFTALFCAVLGPTVNATELDEFQRLARDLLQELIEINTTDSVGDNTAAARAMRLAR